MHVSMPVRRSLALLAVLATASACSDATTAPQATERPAFDIQALQPLDSRSDGSYGNSSRTRSVDENVVRLTIDPNVARTYSFGENWIYFPAHSICDPATSGYGIGLWDSPCTAATHWITVTVAWSSRGGYAYAKFEPALRFVPADNHSIYRWVVLSLHSQKRLKEVNGYSILYYDGDNKVGVDESLTDPTLRAWLDPLHNSVVRRVKHFSGYMVAAAYSDFGGMGDVAY